MESIRFGNLLINFTTEFTWIWDNKGSPNASPVAIWRPLPSAEFLKDYFPLGDHAVADHTNINKKTVVPVVAEAPPLTEEDREKGNALMPPDEYERVWDDKGSKAYTDGAIWRPIPPAGYVAMGLVSSHGYDRPSRNAVRCVRADLVIASYISDLIWNNRRSPAKLDFSAWGGLRGGVPVAGNLRRCRQLHKTFDAHCRLLTAHADPTASESPTTSPGAGRGSAALTFRKGRSHPHIKTDVVHR